MTTDDRELEADEELERLRASLGFIESAPARIVDDRYSIVEPIGRGGMGVVYLAQDAKLPRQVALKLVRARPFHDRASLQRRLAREAEALARVDHPNVVVVYDVGQYRGDLYIVMQHVPGVTLSAWRERAHPTSDQVLDAFLQAARGLAAAHAAGVVHRDFKPDNVLVSSNGAVHVVDFGIADALRADDGTLDSTPTQPEEPTDDRLTKPGSLVGTPPYMAPQQLEGLPAEPRDDQFAFCVSLWESLTGTRPYHADSVTGLLEAMRRGLVLDERIPRSLRRILARGLSYERAQRFADMNALIAALEHARTQGRRWRRGALVGGGLLAAGVVGWFASTLPSDETCQDFRARAATVWNDDTRASLRASLERDPEAVDYAIDVIDELVDRWSHDADELCMQGAAPLPSSPQRRCMEAWLSDLHRHVELLTQANEGIALVPDLLVNLQPARGDYCALRPAEGVDPQIWQLAQAAREAARLGQQARALDLAKQLDVRATELSNGHEYTAERAEAEVAGAEVLARAGEWQAALSRLDVAEKQALGAGYWHGLLRINMLTAKISALSGDETLVGSAAEHVERARPLPSTLALAELDPLRGELAEARGMVARARGQQQEAIELHSQAQQIFEQLGMPVLAARSLNNIGANALEIGDLERAGAAYADALARLDGAKVPTSYPTRIEIEFNLGLLALDAGERSGVDHFEFVVEHGTPDERLDAMALAAQLLAVTADDRADLDDAADWADVALDAMSTQTELDPMLEAKVHTIAGAVLADVGDPRGEALLQSVVARAHSLPPEFVLGVEQTWIELLERQARCEEAGERLERLVQWGPEVHLEAPVQQWRVRRASSLCKRELDA